MNKMLISVMLISSQLASVEEDRLEYGDLLFQELIEPCEASERALDIKLAKVLEDKFGVKNDWWCDNCGRGNHPLTRYCARCGKKKP